MAETICWSNIFSTPRYKNIHSPGFFWKFRAEGKDLNDRNLLFQAKMAAPGVSLPVCDS